MSQPAASFSARLWWAAPSALAVVAALAFAVGFAPRLAQQVRVPTAVSVGGPTAGADDPAAGGGPATRPAPPTRVASPKPSRTSPATETEDGHGGTVVQPERPVVTARPSEDDGTHEAGSGGDG